MSVQEDKLINDIKAGDHRSYSLIINRYKDMVFTLCIRLVKNPMNAEELTQDSFLKAFRSINSYRSESKFSTWLYRIAYNTCISSLRKNGEVESEIDERSLASSENLGLKKMETDDRDAQLTTLLSQLKSEEQLMVQLFYLEEQSIKEIEVITGLSESNIKVKLHRVKQKLKGFIEEDYPELIRTSA